MAGLEIHQQIGFEGSRKLFCDCPAEIIEGEPDILFSRKLRASAGETGTIDVAAAAEQKKAKKFTYHGFKNCCCLVEMDDEPPHAVDPESIKTALMVSKILGSNILSTAQFMRKTIVDGSNVSGFQRTGLIAIGGTIPGLDFEVNIQTVAVEEDAAKIIERTPTEDKYNLSRLGIPLIEIATDPDMKTPEQVQQTAAQLGMILRSTKRVKRGLGTIRQDVNVSVSGGNRVEIKGCQDLRTMKKIVENEAYRQLRLIKLKEENRELRTGDILDVKKEFESSEKVFIKNAIKSGTATGVCINKTHGLFGIELCPGLRIGRDLADLAKTKGFGGIIHSDEDISKYGLESDAQLRDALGCDPEDAFIVVLGKQDEAENLLKEILLPRLSQLFVGVPKEVRKANDDGTTSFLRPMPGGARMYPETDIPLFKLDLDVEVPKLLTDQIGDVAKETGLSKELAREIVLKGIPIQEYKSKYPGLEYSFLSNALIEWPKDISARVGDIPEPEKYVEPLLKDVAEGKIASSSVKAVLKQVAEKIKKGETVKPDEVMSLVEEQLSDEDLKKIVEEVVATNPGLSIGAYMGEIMKKAKGKADGKAIMKFLQERLRG